MWKILDPLAESMTKHASTRTNPTGKEKEWEKENDAGFSQLFIFNWVFVVVVITLTNSM